MQVDEAAEIEGRSTCTVREQHHLHLGCRPPLPPAPSPATIRRKERRARLPTHRRRHVLLHLHLHTCSCHSFPFVSRPTPARTLLSFTRPSWILLHAAAPVNCCAAAPKTCRACVIAMRPMASPRSRTYRHTGIALVQPCPACRMSSSLPHLPLPLCYLLSVQPDRWI